MSWYDTYFDAANAREVQVPHTLVQHLRGLDYTGWLRQNTEAVALYTIFFIVITAVYS